MDGWAREAASMRVWRSLLVCGAPNGHSLSSVCQDTCVLCVMLCPVHVLYIYLKHNGSYVVQPPMAAPICQSRHSDPQGPEAQVRRAAVDVTRHSALGEPHGIVADALVLAVECIVLELSLGLGGRRVLHHVAQSALEVLFRQRHDWVEPFLECGQHPALEDSIRLQHVSQALLAQVIVDVSPQPRVFLVVWQRPQVVDLPARPADHHEGRLRTQCVFGEVKKDAVALPVAMCKVPPIRWLRQLPRTLIQAVWLAPRQLK
mmetsp:Transcript_35674/g.88772  ORF Transcript_35674/g.88772 Transcript_35674/m.88772 type:complete len:260 (+) Transcript_35674:1052-1831(+)